MFHLVILLGRAATSRSSMPSYEYREVVQFLEHRLLPRPGKTGLFIRIVGVRATQR